MATSCFKRYCLLAANVVAYIWIIWRDSLIFLLPPPPQRLPQYVHICLWCLHKTLSWDQKGDQLPSTARWYWQWGTRWVKAVEIEIRHGWMQSRGLLWTVMLKSSPCGYFIHMLRVTNGLKRIIIQCAVLPTSRVKAFLKIFLLSDYYMFYSICYNK